MADEIVLMIFIDFLVFLVGLCIGYCMLRSDNASAVDKISRWIDETQSNQWIQYYMYQELEEKYESLLKEYEQYRGTMTAINDCCKKRKGGIE